MSLDRKLAAEKIREHLERRLAQMLGCKSEQMPRLKLGTCVHLLFALKGDSQELGGFETTMAGILQLVGHEIVWDIAPKEESEESAPKEVIN